MVDMKKILKNKKTKILLLIAGMIMAGSFLYAAYDYGYVYHIKLNGKETEYLNINTEFKDPGVSVRYRGKKFKDYKTESNLDNKKNGTYEVKYIVGKKEIHRKVIVKDTEAPVIKLKDGEKIDYGYGKDFVDPGFEATDNVDGDVTDKVKVEGTVDSKIGEYVLTYKVSDSENNEAIVKRTVNVKDIEGPVLTFKRGINTYAIKGKKIDLNDYTATDNFDGDVTDKVKMEGNVDFDKVGLYKLEYTVEDSNGNKSVVERTVNVQKKNTKGIPVLMYHWFYDDTKGEKAGAVNSHNYISKTNLVKQAKFLKESNYYFPTWEELIDYINKKIDLPEKSVIVTDDDCVASFFNVALPVFQEYQIPVTSFCITKKNTWQSYVDAEYLDLESHTENLHVRKCSGTKWDGAVMCTSYDNIYKDIKTSVEKVKNTYAFAYPFGHYSDDTIKALKANKIKLAFTINSGRVRKGANKYKLPRVRINKGTSIEKYKSLLK